MAYKPQEYSTSVAGLMTTIVTDVPNAAGEYAWLRKDAGASTGTKQAGAMTNPPSSADGFRLDLSNYANQGSAGRAARFEVFVGVNKRIEWQFLTDTGKTGILNPTTEIRDSGATQDGLYWGYDPTTGVAIIDSLDMGSGITTRRAGVGLVTGTGSGDTRPTTCYVDILILGDRT